MSVCRRCGREIEWAQGESGRFGPLDLEPVFVIEGGGNDQFYTDENAVIVGRAARPEEELPPFALTLSSRRAGKSGGPLPTT